MLSSITPLGERGRGNRWAATAAWFVAGAAVAGLVVGALLGLLGAGVAAVVPERARVGLALVVAVAALLADALRRNPGGLRRQVDERWMDQFRSWVYGAGWGAQLGVGAATIVTTAATWAVLVLAVLSGSVAGGAALVGAYGLARGLTVLAARRLDSPEALRAFHRRLQDRLPVARVLVLVAEAGLLAATAVALAA